MFQSAVKFSGPQNVASIFFYLNIYNLGIVNPTEASQNDHMSKGLSFFISDAEYAHRCALMCISKNRRMASPNHFFTIRLQPDRKKGAFFV